MISAAFPKGSWLMVQKSFGQPADVVNILLGVSENSGTPEMDGL